MGQQQLLLVILVTIIVGIATVLAINTFSSSADTANVDAVRQDIAQIAAAAQGYYIKPPMLGGGGNSFTGMTFRDITFPKDSLDSSTGLIAYNANGEYRMVITDANTVTVTASPGSAGGTLVGTITQDNLAMGDYDPEGTF